MAAGVRAASSPVAATPSRIHLITRSWQGRRERHIARQADIRPGDISPAAYTTQPSQARKRTPPQAGRQNPAAHEPTERHGSGAHPLGVLRSLRQRGVQFAAGADAELGEDLAQVPALTAPEWVAVYVPGRGNMLGEVLSGRV